MHHWIDQPDTLHAHLQTRPAVIGMDTEFVRERTYWPKLALVQLALPGPDGLTILLVDPLQPGMPEALVPLLSDPSILKVMHSASEDLQAFHHVCGVTPQPLFDTQIAAALAGLGAGIGYQKLVQQVEGVTLEKGETRSDWMRRPLSPSQLEYAANDVLHLHALHAELATRLQTLGRSDWLRQDCERMIVAASEQAGGERWPHLGVRAAQYLDEGSQRRLLRLLRWREAYARQSDRPRSWILDNELAVTLARTPLADPDALQARLDAEPKAPRKLRDELWQALNTELPDETASPPVRGDDRDKKTMRALQQAVADLSAELGLPDGVLASRRWLESLLDEGQWPAALSGWRRDLLEPRLKPLLAGAGDTPAASV